MRWGLRKASKHDKATGAALWWLWLSPNSCSYLKTHKPALVPRVLWKITLRFQAWFRVIRGVENTMGRGGAVGRSHNGLGCVSVSDDLLIAIAIAFLCALEGGGIVINCQFYDDFFSPFSTLCILLLLHFKCRHFICFCSDSKMIGHFYFSSSAGQLTNQFCTWDIVENKCLFSWNNYQPHTAYTTHRMNGRLGSNR